MTWEQYLLGPQAPWVPAVSWVDWTRLGVTYLLFVVAVAIIVWTVVTIFREDRRRTADREDRMQRFLDMLAEIRALLAVWSVRPRV
jgi:heme exporter protein D